MNYDGNSLEDVSIFDVYSRYETFNVDDSHDAVEFYSIYVIFVNSKNVQSTVRFTYDFFITNNFKHKWLNCVLIAPITYKSEIKEGWGIEYCSFKNETEKSSVLDRMLFDFFNEELIFTKYSDTSYSQNKNYKVFDTRLITHFSDLEKIKENISIKDNNMVN